MSAAFEASEAVEIGLAKGGLVSEARTGKRFPLELPIKIHGVDQGGVTGNMSAAGVYIRGNPATINDSVNGSSQSGQLTFYMRDNRVVSEGKTKQNTSGRTRSVYKVKPQ